MNPQPFNAKITHVSSEGVQVTWHRLPEPEINKPDFDWHKDLQSLSEYEASKVTAWVENVFKLRKINKWLVMAKDVRSYPMLVDLNQFCQVIETGDGKCKIVKLNSYNQEDK